MGITTDNTINNTTFINLLANWMYELGISFDKNENHFRYFAYIIDLNVYKAL